MEFNLQNSLATLTPFRLGDQCPEVVLHRLHGVEVAHNAHRGLHTIFVVGVDVVGHLKSLGFLPKILKFLPICISQP